MTKFNSYKTNQSILSLSILCVALIAVILTVDLSIPLGVAMGVPYVAVVLISLWLPRKATIFVAVVCSVLTFGAYFYKPAVPELWKALCNQSLAVFAIWVSAILGLQRKKAEEKREEALRQIEGQKAMLASIATICHHLGQPTTVIFTNITMLTRAMKDAPDDLKKLVLETSTACDELRSIFQKLMSIGVYTTSNYLDNVTNPDAPQNRIIDF